MSGIVVPGIVACGDARYRFNQSTLARPPISPKRGAFFGDNHFACASEAAWHAMQFNFPISNRPAAVFSTDGDGSAGKAAVALANRTMRVTRRLMQSHPCKSADIDNPATQHVHPRLDAQASRTAGRHETVHPSRRPRRY